LIVVGAGLEDGVPVPGIDEDPGSGVEGDSVPCPGDRPTDEVIGTVLVEDALPPLSKGRKVVCPPMGA
jgi:hypothetical protein